MRNTSDRPDREKIQRAILQALVYADLFDYPLSPKEVIRYLPVPADPQTVRRLLNGGADSGAYERVDGLLTLPERTELVSVRKRRQRIAAEKWVSARRYIRWITCLPFVRMVAVTGSLAVNNVEEDDDVDLLIVTSVDRLWLCRAFVILVVRIAACFGVTVCPNYFLSERQLALEGESFFEARELTQMVPVYGPEVYQRMRILNDWVEAYLPLASGVPDGNVPWIEQNPLEQATKRAMEWLLRGRLGRGLELWERHRKMRYFNRRARTMRAGDSPPATHEKPREGGQVLFTPDCCKGHFDRHGEDIARRFEERLAEYGW